jgi:hypothetical protein
MPVLTTAVTPGPGHRTDESIARSISGYPRVGLHRGGTRVRSGPSGGLIHCRDGTVISL